MHCSKGRILRSIVRRCSLSDYSCTSRGEATRDGVAVTISLPGLQGEWPYSAQRITRRCVLNSDPLLIGVGAVFPNQNSSIAPTVWEEDTDQAAQQGIPCATG